MKLRPLYDRILIKRLDEETWPDPRVQSWIAERAVALKVDAEKESDLAQKFRVEAYPTIVLADASGREIDRMIGFVDAERFVELAESALKNDAALQKIRAR